MKRLGLLFLAIFGFVCFYYIKNSHDEEIYSDLKDVTSEIEVVFKDLDNNNDEILTFDEFYNLKSSYRILRRNQASEYLHLIQEFPDLPVQLGEQIINIEATFKPLLLKSLTKNITDLSKEELNPLQGLLNWNRPFKEKHPFGSKAFSTFLPSESDVKPGYTWWIVEPSKYAGPPPNRRYFPTKVPQKLLILHALLSLFHPQPFLWTRFTPQGTVAIVRAASDNFYDIIFRVHAEFQINQPPLLPFWFTPSQFQGRLIINKDGTVVKFFALKVPDTKLNVDMEWFSGRTEDDMEVDIGYIPEMSLISSEISVPGDNERGANETLSSLQWTYEISMEDAIETLERQFFPFKKVKYYKFPEAFFKASDESKLVHGLILWDLLQKHFVSFWTTVAELKGMVQENPNPKNSLLAKTCLNNYVFPVESLILFPNGSVIHRVNANDLLTLVEKESLFSIQDPLETLYHQFLQNALLMSKAINPIYKEEL
ncbi:hypothetical protein JTE90_013327 [Oedothorax gibbosus]|uniref:Selenoprotein N n=1 Tax=Oedothorax gibbosus TaxID=931172 RepID=A0AAV6VG01_9ARAC|nr:hypothetical protein JTE90_013327 [Oedothorax gibbosus]